MLLNETFVMTKMEFNYKIFYCSLFVDICGFLVILNEIEIIVTRLLFKGFGWGHIQWMVWVFYYPLDRKFVQLCRVFVKKFPTLNFAVYKKSSNHPPRKISSFLDTSSKMLSISSAK